MRICGCVFAVILLCAIAMAWAQPVDWTGDAPLFATGGNERNPVLAIVPVGGAIRGICLLDNSALCSKVSSDGGIGWSAVAWPPSPPALPSAKAAADRQYVYVLVTGSGTAVKSLYRFAPAGNNWETAQQTIVAPGRTGHIVATAVITDERAAPDRPYLNLCWIEREPQTDHFSYWFAQSQDRGQTFQAEQMLTSDDSPAALPEEIGAAVSWSGDSERLIVAAPVDRPGSVGEEIRVFTSDNQGSTWGDSTAIDGSSYAQREVSVAAYENTVFIVYARRINAGIQRDVFMTYSPDGGLHFSPPAAVTDSTADEHQAKVVISLDGTTFGILYLADNGVDESSSVLMREGSVAAPWAISQPLLITEAGSAVKDGGLSATAGPLGFAAAWTARFPLGDTDVRFDASWRGVQVPGRSAILPAESVLGDCYPNPFNGETMLPLELKRGRSVKLTICDVTGRTILETRSGFLAAGSHAIPLQLSAVPSGTYWCRVDGVNSVPRKLVLIR